MDPQHPSVGQDDVADLFLDLRREFLVHQVAERFMDNHRGGVENLPEDFQEQHGGSSKLALANQEKRCVRQTVRLRPYIQDVLAMKILEEAFVEGDIIVVDRPAGNSRLNLSRLAGQSEAVAA